MMRFAWIVSCAAGLSLATVPLEAAEPEATTNSIGMRLVLVPAGEFKMGSDEDLTDIVKDFPDALQDDLAGESPRHLVRITKAFYMSAYETTLKEFLKFYHAANFKTEAERDKKPSWGYGDVGFLTESTMFRPWQPGWEQTQDYPVNYVTWNDAVDFCKWLSRKERKNYRLPTEAEWEYACRAGTTTRYYCGNDPEELVRVGNVADQDRKDSHAAVRRVGDPESNYVSGRDGYVFTAPVGKFRPNAFGLYDMHGNVWEWCQDSYDQKYYGKSPAADPQGPPEDSLRVIRGGAWDSAPVIVRATARDAAPPSRRLFNLGFRVVCELE